MTKNADVQTGDEVEWKWGAGKGRGKVNQVYTQSVEKTIKGSKISRRASKETPAVEVKTNKGSRALKSVSELKKT